MPIVPVAWSIIAPSPVWMFGGEQFACVFQREGIEAVVTKREDLEYRDSSLYYAKL